jgi:hypothetical protein
VGQLRRSLGLTDLALQGSQINHRPGQVFGDDFGMVGLREFYQLGPRIFGDLNDHRDGGAALLGLYFQYAILDPSPPLRLGRKPTLAAAIRVR